MKSVAQRSVFGTPLAAPRVTATRLRCVTQIHSHKRDDVAKVTAGVAAMSLLATQPVMAAQEIATLADGDSRLGAVAFLFVPAIAWVLFNITGPASRQLAGMQKGKPKAATPRSAARRPAPKKKAPAKRR